MQGMPLRVDRPVHNIVFLRLHLASAIISVMSPQFVGFLSTLSFLPTAYLYPFT